ncbi:MAG TPA: CHAD domain-containing protein [Pirellulales bacterium]
MLDTSIKPCKNALPVVEGIWSAGQFEIALNNPMLKILNDQIVMARRSKWIEIESPDEPAVDVAKRALRARLEAVWRYLPDAAVTANDNVENVHQLRVSTRRATAALQLFEAMLPRKRSRWFRKRLKQIRKAAGEARDLDVLRHRLSAACAAEQLAGCVPLEDRLTAAREAAQPAIQAICQALGDKHFRRRMKKLVDKTRWRSPDAPPPTSLAAAQAGLQPLAAAFFTASEGDFENILALHEFRIAGKKLRYAMEVFAAAFAPTFRRELYPLVEELQEKLGALNDHATIRDRYLMWVDETQDDAQRLVLSKLIASETAALQTCIREFRGWWTPERAADLKARFWQEVSTGELRCA